MVNGSGMNRVAESMCAAEVRLGIDAHLVNPQSTLESLDPWLDADVHVSHTHLPDEFRRRISRPYKVVWVGHGTPEHVFQTSVEEGLNHGYGHADNWMLCQHWLRTADALVTFWPRHQAIWKSFCDKATRVDCVPLGVDRSFWKPTPSRGRFDGDPSVFTAENAHYIKWPLDLFIAWPWVVPRVKGRPKLHAPYLPRDQHRWWFPLVNRNDCSYSAHISHTVFSQSELVNVFNSIDFFIGLVQKGDFNRLSLEAAACGAWTISYTGNPYADFWLPEGDQQTIADELVKILNGDIPPREKKPVPDVSETAAAMIEIYQRILS